MSIEFPRVCNKDVRKIGIDAPVAILIGLGQSIACDGATKAQVIEFGLDSIQTGFDVAKGMSIPELSKCHAKVLIEAGEMSGTIISLVLADTAIAIASRQGVHELREEIRSGVHRQAPSTCCCGKVYGIPGGEAEIDAAVMDS